LHRINSELGGNINIDNFKHNPTYDEREGIARSSIESLINQDVYIGKLNRSFHFDKGELLHTEISRKYNRTILENIIADTGLTIKNVFYDSRKYVADFYVEKI
jgi:L-histidine Nalpha-methyltransferase